MATDINYNGTVIGTLEAGKTATLACKGKKARGNIVVAFGGAGSITHDGSATEVEAGKTATLQCAGKKMKSDVYITVESTGEQLAAPTISLDGDILTITDNSGLATSYDLYIDGSLVGNYTSTTIDLTTLELVGGTYKIYVKAKGTNFADSEASELVSYYVKVVGCILIETEGDGVYISTERMTKTWDGIIEYSTDYVTWNEWDGTGYMSAPNRRMYIRGTGNTVITGSSRGAWSLGGGEITSMTCKGNIENLLDYQKVANGEHPTMARGCFQSMFYGWYALTEAPELPAPILADGCYAGMFEDCVSLTTIPELPAIRLATTCYFNMFNYCESLKLSAEQTDEYTIAYRIPTIGPATYAQYALDGMFYGTGGTFTGTPGINTTYYLHSSNSVV